MKKATLTLILTLCMTIMFSIFSILIFAQGFEVPSYELKKVEDYARYEQDVIECVNWLLLTSVEIHPEKRKEASAFLLAWLSGSPNVQIEIKPEIVNFMGSSPDLLLIFMGGWAKHTLHTKDFDNKIAGSLAGIESVISFYTKNIDEIKKDKNVEKYKKMKEKGKLSSFIEKNV